MRATLISRGCKLHPQADDPDPRHAIPSRGLTDLSNMVGEKARLASASRSNTLSPDQLLHRPWFVVQLLQVDRGSSATVLDPETILRRTIAG